MLRADVEGKGAYDNFLPQKRGRVKLVGEFTCYRGFMVRVGTYYNLIFPSLVLYLQGSVQTQITISGYLDSAF